MKSFTSADFWEAYQALPDDIQLRADKAYELWSENPFHPSLHFKKLQGTDIWYSVRIGYYWRAVGYEHEEGITWVWIGSHSEYDKIIKLL